MADNWLKSTVIPHWPVIAACALLLVAGARVQAQTGENTADINAASTRITQLEREVALSKATLDRIDERTAAMQEEMRRGRR